MMNVFRAVILVCIMVFVLGAHATAPKPPAKPPVNAVKGQGQFAGANGQFQTVYSLRNGFNFAILSARYSVDSFRGPCGVSAGTDEKLVVLTIAVKNVSKSDNFFNFDDFFTIVDANGQLYQHRDFHLISKGGAIVDMTLRPGQGMGQSELKDPLEVVFAIPAAARIVKVMVNQGRVIKPDEKVLRYYVAGAKKTEAGEDGDPKNVIEPLPATVSNPADKSSATALEEGNGLLGQYLPSGGFALRIDSLIYSTTETADGNPPGDDQHYAIATITAKAQLDTMLTFFDVQGGDNPLYLLTPVDGDPAPPTAYRKAKKDEVAEYNFKYGEEYTFRVFFTLPKDAVAKSITLGVGNGRKWTIPIKAAVDTK